MNSSLMCRSIRRQSLACTANGSSRKGPHSFSNRFSNANCPRDGGRLPAEANPTGLGVKPLHSRGPLRQDRVFRVQLLQFVDVPQQSLPPTPIGGGPNISV